MDDKNLEWARETIETASSSEQFIQDILDTNVWNQEQIAAKIGVDRGAISRWKSNNGSIPKSRKNNIHDVLLKALVLREMIRRTEWHMAETLVKEGKRAKDDIDIAGLYKEPRFRKFARDALDVLEQAVYTANNDTTVSRSRVQP